MMRRGNYDGVNVSMSARGNLIAISTGADFTAEHEHGIDGIFKELTSYSSSIKDDLIAKFKNQNSIWNIFKQETTIPNVFELKRIINPDLIQFEVISADEAYLGFHPNRSILNFKQELIPTTFVKEKGKGITGAWDDESFAFHAFTPKSVKLLKEMHEEIKKGNVVFGGNLFTRATDQMTGIVLAIANKTKDVKKEKIEATQTEFEDGIRLTALADVEKLKQLLVKASGDDKFCVNTRIGYIWPQWSNAEKTEFKYNVNPSNSIREYLDGYGTYTEKALYDWVKAGMNYPLKPSR